MPTNFTIYSHILLPCPTCQGHQYYEGLEDELKPRLPTTNFCHHCAKYDGLKEEWVPTHLLLHAFRPGNTQQQAYAELVEALQNLADTSVNKPD